MSEGYQTSAHSIQVSGTHTPANTSAPKSNLKISSARPHSRSPVHHNMALRQLLRATLLLFVAGVLCEHGPIHVPISFKRIGKYATGLSFGHIKTVIGFKKIDQAHEQLANLFQRQEASTSSADDKQMLHMLQHQFSSSTSTIDRLRTTFFKQPENRPKRQLFAGLSFLTGILSFGTSIYNSIEISKIHSELSDVRQGTRHIAHTLEQQDHAISTLTSSVDSIKHTSEFLLRTTGLQEKSILSLRQFGTLSTLLNTHNAEIAAWGRGIESLLHGRLHPTVVDHSKLTEALTSLTKAAAKHGLKPLHQEASSIFKADVSFVATQDHEIFIYVHVPLVDCEPLDLFEHLPVPFELNKMLVTLESEKNVIASDELGTFGTELKSSDILHCHTVKTHHGNVYACPNSNLLNRQIRKTCLGSLLFGDSATAAQTCQQKVQRAETTQDFAVQIRTDTLLVYSQENSTVRETCRNGTRNVLTISKLTTVKATTGCKMIGNSFLLKPEFSLFAEADLIDSVAAFDAQDLMPTTEFNAKDFRRALEELEKIEEVKPRSMTELRTWLRQSDQSFRNNAINVTMATGAIAITAGLIAFIAWQYIKFSRMRASTHERAANQ